MVGGDQHDSGQFAVSPGHRLHGGLRKSEQFAEHAFGFIQHRQSALGQGRTVAKLGQQRMQSGKTGQTHHFLMQARIVFHGAGAKRVEIGVHAHVHPAQIGEMADRFEFGNFRQCRGGRTAQSHRNSGRLRDIESRQDRACAAGAAGFIDQFHR